MANIKSAIKRNKQNEKRRLRNRLFGGLARTFVKRARLAIEAGNLETSVAATREAIIASMMRSLPCPALMHIVIELKPGLALN